jgi:hypothetical protein
MIQTNIHRTRSGRLMIFLEPGSCFQSGGLNLEPFSKIDSRSQFDILPSRQAGAGNFSEVSCRAGLSGGYDPASNTVQFILGEIARSVVFY